MRFPYILVDPIVNAISDILGHGQPDFGERRTADREIDPLSRHHRQIGRICSAENLVNITRGPLEAFLVARGLYLAGVKRRVEARATPEKMMRRSIHDKCRCCA
jgi:hypothetical protein